MEIQDMKLNINEVNQIRKSLSTWYLKNKRDLPWRIEGIQPYNIWISEIMSQQTRIKTVIDYYNKWMIKYPNVESLAKSNQDEVNAMWSGLGYYRRCKFIFEASKVIENDFKGIMPNNAKDLKKLPGIGDYTAGAIASICFDEKIAAVDGNVLRVFARLFAIEKPVNDVKFIKECWKIGNYLQETVNVQDIEDLQIKPGNINQALMEIGATICVPKGKPDCLNCPLNKNCKAYLEQDDVLKYPAKKPKKKKANPTENFNLTIITRNNGIKNEEVLIFKRPLTGGLLSGQFEFLQIKPETKFINQLESNGCCKECLSFFKNDKIEKLGNVRHIFSHLTWLLEVNKTSKLQTNCNGNCLAVSTDNLWVCKDKLLSRGGEYSLTTSQKKALNLYSKQINNNNNSTVNKRKKQKVIIEID